MDFMTFSREIESIGCMYFKELADEITEADKFKVCTVGWQAGDQGRADAAVQV